MRDVMTRPLSDRIAAWAGVSSTIGGYDDGRARLVPRDIVSPDGWHYQTTGQAASEAEAVRLADEVLEHVERVGISDFLEPDGLSVTPPARLLVERVTAEKSGPGFGLVITDPQGKTTRK